ncbi:terminase small subunit [Brevundimonas phage vB_BpoS-Papperlapapp]|uniref:Terminase small subunit n=2 Tax=Marchewkavirus TaxID=3425052 RepID=A0A9E7SJI9_9CAUD|nr:terminase small subunit [Brevundimonas phage vB_BpoS-Kabachok]USN14537.1 terminase small subunit [Brevundimonas phage vB_BpoS-Domovoi]USN15908.1 terminase small subunit [Brevundimonas phage vB_BpoS-Papperlapapp]
MARLANERNELYARHRAKGMNAAKAAMAAGYAPGSSTQHLETDPDVIARIEELYEDQKAQREAQRLAAVEAAKVVGQMTGVSRAFVIQKLAENAQNAAADGQFKESNAALELIGKDLGMFSGGQGDDTGSSVPQSFDLDKLDAVLGDAIGALPQSEKSEAELSREFGHDTAMELIQGHVKKERIDPKDRKLTTGSETDVALMDDARAADVMGKLDALEPLEAFDEPDFS